MRLVGAVVRVKRSTLVILIIFSLFTVSLLLVNRLDIVLLDDVEKQADGSMCRCAVNGIRSAGGQDRGQGHETASDDGVSATRWFQKNAEDGKLPFASSENTSTLNFEDLMRQLVERSRLDNANSSLNDIRRTLDELRSAVHVVEQRLRDEVDSTEINNNNNNSNNNGNDYYDYKQLLEGNATNAQPSPSKRGADPVVEPIEVVLQPNGATTDERRRSRVIAERFHRVTNHVRLSSDVLGLLNDAVALTSGNNRKPRPTEKLASPVLHRSNRRPWKEFENSITQYALYRGIDKELDSRKPTYVDRLLKNMATLSVRHIDEMTDRGTQLKLIFTLSDGTKVLFKPMRISKYVESNPNHFVFNEMERHHAEIAAFHLDRLFDFRRVPPVAGRYINVTTQIIPFASQHLMKTFFISPVGNICFYGECKYYCDSHHAVCGTPDVIEGSAAVFLPNDDDEKGIYPRKTWPNPWAQVYSKRGKLPPWKTREDYCDEIKRTPPYDDGRRLLDLMDMSMFDFLTGNLDRHHYYTFKRFGNDTCPILTDNGRGFGRPNRDDIELLAPIYQCCLIRASTLQKVVSFASAEYAVGSQSTSLSKALNQSLADDVIQGVLHNGHLTALDRRIKTVALVVHDCLNRTLTAAGIRDKSRLGKIIRKVVIDDGF